MARTLQSEHHKGLVNACLVQIRTKLLLVGEPDLGLDCLAMVGNNKLLLWQEQFFVNISD